MRHRVARRIAAVLVLAAAAAAPAEAARYRYGSYYGAGAEEPGWFVELEAAATNPRNADPVVATSEIREAFGGGTNRLTRIVPSWDDDPAGRLAVGYQWAGGNSVQVTAWSYEAEVRSVDDGLGGEILHFAVGPPIWAGTDWVGDSASPGHFDLTTKIEARTLDVGWARSHEPVDAFTLRWSIGLRYAEFEETIVGFYDEARSVDAAFGQLRYAADKSNQAEMVGGRVGMEGRYRLGTRWSVGGRLALTFLDGEATATSGLTPTGTLNATTVPASLARIEDDGRSGAIREIDVRASWHSVNDRLEVSLGWEQAKWEDIAADLVRSFPGQSAPLAERPSVAFSGYKLGLRVRF